MPPRDHPRADLIFLAVLAGLFTLSFLHSPGTSDVQIWESWARNADHQGLRAGFAANQADYPPLTSALLFCAVRGLRPFGALTFLAIKISIALFLFLTSLLFWLWTKDLVATLILHAALTLNSVALGYTDIYTAPSLVLALWALKERRYLPFTIFYTLACLTKWQPLIIAPFILLYLLNLPRLADWRRIDFKKLFWQVCLPATLILLATLSFFGHSPVWQAFRAAMSPGYLSGNALNLNWILTHLLEVFQPEQFGGLVQGEARYILTDSRQITLVPRLLFYLFYLASLVVFLRRAKTFTNLVVCASTGYLAYFTFNTGVHENHLFLVAILAVLLFWLQRSHQHTMLLLVLLRNANLFLFYGVNGQGPGFPRALARILDIALVLAIFNVIFFVHFFWGNLFGENKASAGARGTYSATNLAGPPG
jgi:hypothetical protein